MSEIKFRRCNKSTLNNVPVVDGQLIYVKDTLDSYLDVDSTRIKIGDIVFTDTLDNITPIENKIYYSTDTNELNIYVNNKFINIQQGKSIKYDNTTSQVEPTNVQSAIDLIFTKLNELEQSLKTVSQTVQSNKTEYDTTITQIQVDIKKIKEDIGDVSILG